MDLIDFPGGPLALLRTIVGPPRWDAFEKGLSTGAAWEMPTEMPTLDSLRSDVLREPRAVLAAAAALDEPERSRLANLAVIESWVPTEVMSFATAGQMYFRTALELEHGHPNYRRALLDDHLGPIYGHVDFPELVGLGAALGWSVEDLIDTVASSYPRCSDFDGLAGFIEMHAEALRARVESSPEAADGLLAPFFRNLDHVPPATVALFSNQLEEVANSRRRGKQRKLAQERAQRLLDRIGDPSRSDDGESD